MGKPCSVCAHPKRADIDMALAQQVVSVASLARLYGLGHDSVTRHRKAHIPDFLPAFAASAEALEPGTVRAEAERLYLHTLDALAAAQAGVLVAEDADGKQVRRISSSAVARLISEARKGLDLLARLAAESGSGSDVAPVGINAELDQRIADALARVAQRQLEGVVDAEVVEDAAAGGGDTPTPGGGAVKPPAPSRRLVGVPDTETAVENPGVQNGHTPGTDLRVALNQSESTTTFKAALERGSVTRSEAPAEEPVMREPVWEGNPAASPDERRAAGFDVLPERSTRLDD